MSAPHILYVVDHFPTLSQTFIENQMRTLVELGFRVTVLSFGQGAPKPMHDTTEWLLDRITLLQVPLPESAGRSVIPPEFWRAGARLPPAFRLLQSLGRYRSRVVLGAEALLPKLEADAILAHFGPNGLYAAGLRSLGTLKGPITTFFHGYDFSSFVQANGPRVYDLLFRQGDRFIANSDYSRRRLVSTGCPEKRLSVLPVGLLPENFTPPIPPKTRSDETIRFLSVGRLVEKKGHAFAIAAMGILLRDGIDAHLTLVGDGPDRKSLDALAERYGLGERIVFAGARCQAAVQALMRESDVFLLASIEASDGDVEGQGLVLQEAQACGLPVIATRHNGFPESLQENTTGLLVPERDAAALAEAMKSLALDTSARARMAAAGPGFVAATFDQRLLTRRLVALLGLEVTVPTAAPSGRDSAPAPAAALCPAAGTGAGR
jgi:colanic acid/amylovoran biosynthesis glycosyltransferase